MTIDPITGLPSSNTQNPVTGIVSSDAPVTNAMPQVTPNMTYDSVTGRTPVLRGNLGSTEPTRPADNSYLGMAQSAFADSGAISPEQAKQNELMAKYESLLGISGGNGVAADKASETARLNAQFGVSETQSRINEIAKTISANDLATEGQKLSIQGKGYGMDNVQAGSARFERENTIRKLGLASESLALQGKLDSARAAVKEAIDLKYAGEEQKLAAIEKYLTINEQALSRADAKALDKQKTLLSAKQKDLEEKKANDVRGEQLILEARQSAPADVIERAMNIKNKGGSNLEIAQALGVYGGDYLKNELLKEQIKKTIADTAKTRSEIVKIDNQASLLTAQPTGVVTAPNGDSIGLPNETLSAIGRLKLNEGQANAVAFTSRMIQSNKAIDTQLGKIKPTGGFYETEGYDPTSVGSSFGRFVGSDKSRVYSLNSQDFIRAKLRKESGAVISSEEMEADAKIYAPFGAGLDEKDLQIAQIKRDEAIKSMIAQSGPAAPYLQQYYEQSKSRGYEYDQYLDDIALPSLQKAAINSNSSSAYANSLLSN